MIILNLLTLEATHPTTLMNMGLDIAKRTSHRLVYSVRYNNSVMFQQNTRTAPLNIY